MPARPPCSQCIPWARWDVLAVLCAASHLEWELVDAHQIPLGQPLCFPLCMEAVLGQIEMDPPNLFMQPPLPDGILQENKPFCPSIAQWEENGGLTARRELAQSNAAHNCLAVGAWQCLGPWLLLLLLLHLFLYPEHW